MKSIAIIPNLLRDVNGEGTKTIIEYLKKKNINVFMDHSLAVHNFEAEYVDIETFKDIDIAIIIGGDGTILSASKNYINTDIPILGINHGNIGFLTELEKNDMQGLDDIINGNFSL